MIPIYVGFDHREKVAYHVFCHSVLQHATENVAFIPVTGEQRDGSNSFIYQRFLVPFMQDYQGWAIFADGDMLCRADINELWGYRDDSLAALVVKHNYRTKYPVKYLGNKNEDYPRKNWSSLMLINCARWKHLTPSYVQQASGSHLHRFQFLTDAEIGALPFEWNWLVGEYGYHPTAKLVHFTIGTPCFPEYMGWNYADEWYATKRDMESHA